MNLGNKEKNTLGDGCGRGEAGVFYQGGGRFFGNGSDLKFLRKKVQRRPPKRIFYGDRAIPKDRDI